MAKKVKISKKTRALWINRLKPPRLAEEQYVRDLRTYMQWVHKQYEKILAPWILQIGKHDGVTQVSLPLDQLEDELHRGTSARISPLVFRLGTSIENKAKKVKLGLLGITEGQLKMSAEIQAARDANILLVQKAQTAYAESIRAIFDEPANFGLRVEELQQMLVERGEVSESRAELIARDQTLKLNGAITESRQKSAGVTQYVWSTSQDERVRPSHKVLEGTLQDWNVPPPPGHPGKDFQCRCVAIPYIPELDNPEDI